MERGGVVGSADGMPLDGNAGALIELEDARKSGRRRALLFASIWTSSPWERILPAILQGVQSDKHLKRSVFFFFRQPRSHSAARRG